MNTTKNNAVNAVNAVNSIDSKDSKPITFNYEIWNSKLENPKSWEKMPCQGSSIEHFVQSLYAIEIGILQRSKIDINGVRQEIEIRTSKDSNSKRQVDFFLIYKKESIVLPENFQVQINQMITANLPDEIVQNTINSFEKVYGIKSEKVEKIHCSELELQKVFSEISAK